MIDGSEKRNRQLAFELQNSHVCEKHSKPLFPKNNCLILFLEVINMYATFITSAVCKV